jgi:hypothetical protein
LISIEHPVVVGVEERADVSANLFEEFYLG